MKELRLVLGVGRSGTTWLSYVLARTPTPIRFFMEGMFDTPSMLAAAMDDLSPVGYASVLPDGDPLLGAYRAFLSEGREWPPALERYLERDDPDWRYCLVKEVHGLLAAEAILRQLPCKALLLARDPVRVADSLLARDGLGSRYLRTESKQFWVPAFTERFGNRQLKPMGDGDRWRTINRVTITVAAINAMFVILAGEFDNAMLVRYEDLCRQPSHWFRISAEFLDLAWGSENERLLGDTTAGQHRKGVRFPIFRDSARQLDKPFTFLTGEEAEACYRLIGEIGNA